MYWIIDVKYIKDYHLKVTFNDGAIKIIDFSKYVGGKGIYKELRDINYFKSVKIDEAGNSICWENGADFCPDVLYQIGDNFSDVLY